MIIDKLQEFAKDGDKNLDDFNVSQGFVQAEKPARQWFNSILNTITLKTNEVIDKLVEFGDPFITYDVDQIVNDVTIDAGQYLRSDYIAKESITGDKIAKATELNEPRIKTPVLTTTFASKTLDTPNLVLASDGTLKTSNDPLNASTRKVGTANGNVVVRGTDGYPVNNNAIGVGQTWQNVMTLRTHNTNYTNNTGRPIAVSMTVRGVSGADNLYLYVGSVIICDGSALADTGQQQIFAIVPSGSTYRLDAIASSVIISWAELR